VETKRKQRLIRAGRALRAAGLREAAVWALRASDHPPVRDLRAPTLALVRAVLAEDAPGEVDLLLDPVRAAADLTERRPHRKAALEARPLRSPLHDDERAAFRARYGASVETPAPIEEVAAALGLPVPVAARRVQDAEDLLERLWRDAAVIHDRVRFALADDARADLELARSFTLHRSERFGPESRAAEEEVVEEVLRGLPPREYARSWPYVEVPTPIADDVLRLDGFVPEDATALDAGADDAVRRTALGDHPQAWGRVDIARWIEAWQREWRAGHGYEPQVRAVRRVADGALVGGCARRWSSVGLRDRPAIEVWILPTHRRRGYATRALRLLCADLHRVVDRIEVRLAAADAAACALVTAAGFVREGVLRRAGEGGGDVAVYALLSDDPGALPPIDPPLVPRRERTAAR
jgi:RimJ/RimL family protein N-acetyltransferase